MVLWGHEEHVLPFIARQLECEADFGNCQTAVVTDRLGTMIAGVVFHNWRPESEVMEVSAASIDRKWASRTVLKELFGYVFANCQACVARCAEDNAPVRRLWRAFGAKEYIIPRLGGRTASEAILLLTDDAWADSKFMRPRNGQKVIGSAAA